MGLRFNVLVREEINRKNIPNDTIYEKAKNGNNDVEKDTFNTSQRFNMPRDCYIDPSMMD